MFDQPFVVFILLGLVLKVSGFLVRDELLLRVLVALGTLFDILFYYVQSPTIWGSVLTNTIMVSVNLSLITIIFLERSTWFMSAKEKRAFENFKTLSPGQFRRVIRKARWRVAPHETVLLHEGVRSERLYFLESETFRVHKQGTEYEARGPAFAGEIMLLQGGVASASVSVPAGTVYAEWHKADLERLMKKSRNLENAMIARFGHDLADKVRNSVPLRVASTGGAAQPLPLVGA